MLYHCTVPSLTTSKSNWQVLGFSSYLQRKINEVFNQDLFLSFFLQYKSPTYKVGHLRTWTEGKKQKKKETNITYHLKLLQLTKRHPQKVIVQNSCMILNMDRKN